MVKSSPSINVDKINDVCVYSNTQIDKLKREILQNKGFMNMVIHDMRNPTVAIKLGLKDTINSLKEIEFLLKDTKQFNEKCQ